MTKEPVLAKILRYLMYATAFTPLIIFSQFMSPFHFGKVVIFRSIIEIALVFYILLIWQDRTYLPKLNKIVWAFLLFTAAFTITTLTSVQSYQSFWGTLERMGGLWTFWHYFIFFIILISVLKTKEQWLKFLDLTILIGVLSAVYGFGQKTDIKFFVGSGGRARIFGTLGNPALFAGYQILTLFLAITFYFRNDNGRNKKLFYAGFAITNIIAVLMTAVRGSLLAIVVGLLCFLLLRFLFYGSHRAKKAFIWLVVSGILFAAFSLLFFHDSKFVQQSPYWRRLTDISPTTFTVKTRFWAWEAGLKGWADGPRYVLLGYGPENFNIPFSKYFNPKFFTGPGAETLFDRAHNMFVEILVTMGLLGFLAYAGIFVVIFKTLWRLAKQHPDGRIYGIGLISLILAYIVHNSFIFDTSANFIIFFIILGFIYFLSEYFYSSNPSVAESAFKSGKSISLRGFIGLILFIISAVLIYKTNIVPAKANYATTRAIVLGWQKDFNSAVKKYREAVAYDTPGKYDIRQRFAQYMLEQSNNVKAFSPELQSAMQAAVAAVKKNADENPLDYLPKLYLARLNLILGKQDPISPYNDTGLAYAFEALKLSPTFVRTNYEIAQGYLNKKNLKKAEEYFKRAVVLNPDVGLSLWYLGAVEFDLKNEQLAMELIDRALEKGFVASETDYAKMVTIYYGKRNFNKLAVVYQKLIDLNPKNPQYHASAAVVYARAGKIDDAVDEARIAAKLDATFESEARRFVESLGRAF